MKALLAYLLAVAIALDQLANTLLGGSPDEMISSAVGRKAIMGRRWALAAERPINALFALLGEKNHCRSRIEWEELAPTLRAELEQLLKGAANV